MKKLTYITIFSLLLVSCSYNIDKNNQLGENIDLDTLLKTSSITILGQLNNGLLEDTFKVFEYDTLRLLQKWKDGILVSTDYYDNSKIRRLEYVIEKIDSLTFNSYYKDIKDIRFTTYPYNIELIRFYDSIKVLTNCKFKENQSTCFNILNVPLNEITIAVAGGIVKIKKDTFRVNPNRLMGDTLKIMYWYGNVGHETEFEIYIIE